jgi:hypothetical protein
VLSYERVHQQALSTQRRASTAYLASRLSDLVEYGPSFLTPEELQAAREQLLAQYYRVLAVGVVNFRERAFWSYNRERLSGCGCPLSYSRLAKAVLAKAAELVVHPAGTAGKVLRRLGRPASA